MFVLPHFGATVLYEKFSDVYALLRLCADTARLALLLSVVLLLVCSLPNVEQYVSLETPDTLTPSSIFITVGGKRFHCAEMLFIVGSKGLHCAERSFTVSARRLRFAEALFSTRRKHPHCWRQMLPFRGTLVQHETETSSLLAPNASVPRNSCSARDGNILTVRAKCFRSAEVLFSTRRKHPHCSRQMLPLRGSLVRARFGFREYVFLYGPGAGAA